MVLLIEREKNLVWCEAKHDGRPWGRSVPGAIEGLQIRWFGQDWPNGVSKGYTCLTQCAFVAACMEAEGVPGGGEGRGLGEQDEWGL